MEKILGLDLGTNSIGWAIREINPELENQFVKYGVLTFEKGVGETKGIEVPLVQTRTMARSKRRNYEGRKYRKWAMLKALIQNEPSMCPLSMEELDNWRKYKKGFGRLYPENTVFLNWLRLDFNNDGKPDYEDPYLLRKIAAEQIIDSPLILGRIFYNLVQRRGFKGREDNESKTIASGTDEVRGAECIKEIMKQNDTTLGGALYIDLKENKNRIRKRYSFRSDFEDELNIICKVQGIQKDSELYKKLYSAIIWQRPLRSQKGNVGRCIFEPGKQRCPVSHPLYEKFRALVFINNIKITSADNELTRTLTPEEKNLIYEKLFLRKSKPQFEFIDIKKLLDKKNLLKFNYKNSTNIAGCPVTAAFKDVFKCNVEEIKIPHNVNTKRNGGKDYYDFHDLWHVLFTADSDDYLKKFASEKLHLDEDLTKKFISIKVQQGYGSISLYVIKKLLSLLEEGLIYSDAIYLANLDKVLNRELTIDEIKNFVTHLNVIQDNFKKYKKELAVVNSLIRDYLELENEQKYGNTTNWIMMDYDREMIKEKINEYYGEKYFNTLPDAERIKIKQNIEDKYSSFMQNPLPKERSLCYFPVPRLDERINNCLKNEFGIDETKLNKLYHPSEVEEYKEAPTVGSIKVLGDPMPLSNGFKNPMALKTLHKLKILVNSLLEEKIINTDTRIVIEIARELNDANKRKAIELYQRKREKENKEFAEKILEMSEGVSVDIDNPEIIDKYRLWIEQDHKCLYTGRTISFSQLFNGTVVDIEHTIPASLSFDNELKNKTLCFSDYNREIKKNKIPYDLPNYSKSVEINGIMYPSISENIKFIKVKIDDLIIRVEKAKGASKRAASKEEKDRAIQNRHIAQFDLDYWEKKYDTFTIEEYKAGWRNSQLVDTKIITKYALPYMKTVFNKVEVQKGIITSEFRKIFNVDFKKDRAVHSHHAIDAAILTLVPSAIVRDRLLKKHFELLELNKSFHTSPKGWKKFRSGHILEIQNNVLIFFQSTDRTFCKTKKVMRKRGKVQYVKEKLPDNKWNYKTDNEGKKIPVIQTGNSVRGQLHKETFFGAITNPNTGNISYVAKVPVNGFGKIEDIDSIVDKKVRESLKFQINSRISEGKSFQEAVNSNLWLLNDDNEPITKDKNGKDLSPVRHVRCIAKAGRGELSKARAIKEHVSKSKNDYKNFYYVQNDVNYLYLLYEAEINDEIKKTCNILNFMDISDLQVDSLDDLFKLENIKHLRKDIKGNNIVFDLKYFIRPGTHVLLYEKDKQEIFEDKNGLHKRLYRVFKFNEMNGSTYIYLKYNNEARQDKDLPPAEKTFEFSVIKPVLTLNQNQTNFLVEGFDFRISVTGDIIFND